MEDQPSTDLAKFGKLIETIFEFGSKGDLYSCVAEIVPQIVPADHVTITLYDVELRTLVIRSAYGEQLKEFSEGEQLPTKPSYEEYAQSVSKPIIYSPAENLSNKLDKDLHDKQLTSVLIVPLLSGRNIIGTINVAAKSHQYTIQDQFKLEQLSALLATSISHAEVFRDSEQATVRQRLYAQHLEYLNDISEKLSRATSIDQALDLVAQCATKLVNATRVSFCELEPDRKTVKIIGLVGITDDLHGQRISLEESGLEDCLIYSRKRYVTDLLTSSSRSQRSLGESGIKHIWSFPIKVQDKINRCINISSKHTDLHTDDAMSVLDTLSRLLGSTLERLHAQWETEKQAKTDSLTGLNNRAEFHRQLGSAISVPVLAAQEIGIMYFDLDLFKNINDTLGHDVGDKVLQEVSVRLRHSLAAEDTLARIGGDEFMVLLTNLSSREQRGEKMENIAQNIISSLSRPFNLHNHDLKIGVSIGICRFPNDGKTVDDLIKNADIAMYKAKELGRNRYHFYTQELSRELSERLQLEQDLKQAISSDQLSLVFQPQYNAATLEMECVEVLLRWIHPALGFIPPDVFIPLAEKCGLMERVTDWVLKNSLQNLVEFQRHQPQLKVAVNISAVEFSFKSNLYFRVMRAIKNSAIDPQFLELELTETAFLEYPEHASLQAKELSSAGIKLAIDDFGTGYASLSCLVQLPINCIKIDRSFVDGVESDDRKQAVIKGIVAISKSLHVNCVAEGIETSDQLNWLVNVGCDYLQGYLLSKPVSAEELIKVINHADHKYVKMA